MKEWLQYRSKQEPDVSVRKSHDKTYAEIWILDIVRSPVMGNSIGYRALIIGNKYVGLEDLWINTRKAKMERCFADVKQFTAADMRISANYEGQKRALS